ncbi:MAG: endonuclease Q family protein [Bacteroidota bacterium]
MQKEIRFPDQKFAPTVLKSRRGFGKGDTDFIMDKQDEKQRYIADLHVHSPYAQATSRYITLTGLYQWAQIKGIDVVGTGDFTHPKWLATLKEELVEVGNGFFRLKKVPTIGGLPGIEPQQKPVYFCLSTEISTIYSYKGRMRKSHHLVYAPDFATVDKLNAQLGKIGNLAADGRPILGLSARNLLEIVCNTSPRCYLVPAHIWTPWFSILGSKAGYDSVADAFRDLADHIFALETGLSSDPAMNWQISDLDRYTMMSNSDAHSLPKLGREANRFDTILSYDGLFAALKTRKGFKGTLEYFPEEGKYHLDGHRACGVCFTPAQSRASQGRCPKCKRWLTLGVLHRVTALADRSSPQQPATAPNFDYIVPLPEIIAQIIGQRVNTKRVTAKFIEIINHFGSEFNFLCNVPLSAIAAALPTPYVTAIQHLRTHKVKKIPGYDGVYGQMILWEEPNLFV